MESILEDIGLKIDKSNWTPVKLGDVVDEPRETCKDPISEGIQHIVGLEHITSKDIHLRESDPLEETSFSRYFRENDVLFGRRRAYLKKAAKASFSGICSGDITVLRAKEGLRPDLLPFIVNNDKFFDYAIKHSAGGLSPRVKFKDLANYEFLLPPKDQQTQLAELLWAMDNVIETEKEILDKIYLTKKSFEKKHLLKYSSQMESNLPEGSEVYKLKEIAEISGGSTPSRNNQKYWDGNIPWLTPTDVTNHDRINLDATTECITESGLKNISNRLYPAGSILYCSRATIGEAIINDVPMATNQGFSNFVVNDKVNSYFLYYLLKHITPELTRLAGGSTFLEISKSAIRNFKVSIPHIDEQEKLVQKLNEFESNRLNVTSMIALSKSLLKGIIGKIF